MRNCCGGKEEELNKRKKKIIIKDLNVFSVANEKLVINYYLKGMPC